MPDKVLFYTDEHVSKAVVRGLRQRGADLLTCQEANMLGAEDWQHLEFAAAQKRAIFTQDTDFIHLHALGLYQYFGIVYAAQQTSISKVINGLLLIWEILDASEMVNQVEYV